MQWNLLTVGSTSAQKHPSCQSQTWNNYAMW